METTTDIHLRLRRRSLADIECICSAGTVGGERAGSRSAVDSSLVAEICSRAIACDWEAGIPGVGCSAQPGRMHFIPLVGVRSSLYYYRSRFEYCT
jgi:hypothetical protein